MDFVPLKDFHDEDLRSDYLAGLSYSVRQGDDVLAEKVDGWASEGKVRIIGADSEKTRSPRLNGAGKID